jgi:transcriptional regulator with XRE-family HTH domain
MAALRPASPGERLKTIRVQLNLTTREVAKMSQQIASDCRNDEFAISHARLVQIENDQSTPSIYKLFALAATYGRSLHEVVSLYINVDALAACHLALGHHYTHLLTCEPSDSKETKPFPVRIDTRLNASRTNLIPQAGEGNGKTAIGIVDRLDNLRRQYALIGLQDYTMFPLIRPGSLVEIDTGCKYLPPALYQNEWERPVYFTESRSGFVCSWCELKGKRLFCLPHPLSPVRIQEFESPGEAEIIGRVVAVTARLVAPEKRAVKPVC